MSSDPSRHKALRAIAEGARATIDLLAEATGRSPARLKGVAKREGWNLDPVSPQDFEQRLRPIVARLLDRVEALGRQAGEDDGKVDRTEIDGVVAMIRAIDKIAEFTRPEEAAKEKQIKTDEDMAAALRTINDRIVHLARELAAQLADGTSSAGQD